MVSSSSSSFTNVLIAAVVLNSTNLCSATITTVRNAALTAQGVNLTSDSEKLALNSSSPPQLYAYPMDAPPSADLTEVPISAAPRGDALGDGGSVEKLHHGKKFTPWVLARKQARAERRAEKLLERQANQNQEVVAEAPAGERESAEDADAWWARAEATFNDSSSMANMVEQAELEMNFGHVTHPAPPRSGSLIEVVFGGYNLASFSIGLVLFMCMVAGSTACWGEVTKLSCRQG